MERNPIASSMIHSIGYDQNSRVLEIEFKDGKVIDYIGVPPYEARDLQAAQSVGRYYLDNIRGKYSVVNG